MASLSLFRPNGAGFHKHDPFELARELLSFDRPAAVADRPPKLSPRFDVLEREDSYLIEADLPGVKEARDLELTLDGDQLTIAGSRQATQNRDGENYQLVERRFGSFSRTFSLPREIDGARVEAKLADGILEVVIPKKADARARKIPIK